MKIDLQLEVVQGRVTLVGKTFEQLNEYERSVMNGLFKKEKQAHGQSN